MFALPFQIRDVMRFSKSSCTFVSASRCMAEAHASSVSAGGIKPIQLPARSPNLNAYAERWVRSAKEECLSKLILFGEASLRRALTAFLDHDHQERNHQGKNNVVLFPASAPLVPSRRPGIHCRERLGGLLRYYSRAA